MSSETKRLIGRLGLGVLFGVPMMGIVYFLARSAIRDFGIVLVPACGIGLVIVLLIGIFTFWAFPERLDG